MATIQCKTEIPAGEGLKDNEITVGREFFLACEGEFPKNLNQEKLHFVLDEAHKYQIHLLSFEFRSPTQADMKITAYKTGNIQFQDLQITDGTETLSLGPVQYDVQTVIEQQPQQAGQPAQPPQPYGPIGPATMAVPMLYWAVLASAVTVALGSVAAFAYRNIQRRNMIERLKEHDSALSPLAQFHQNFRRLQRMNSVFFGGKAEAEHIQQCLDETYKMLKLYLTRRYRIPALEWTPRLILKDLKKYQRPVYVECGIDLAQLLKEYERGAQDKKTLKEEDVLMLTKQCRSLVEKMEAMV